MNPVSTRPLFDELVLRPGDEFRVPSSRPNRPGYLMIVTADYTIVHQGQDCEGVRFTGHCHHIQESEKFVVTQNRAPVPMSKDLVLQDEAKVPMRIDFTDDQLKNIALTVCNVGGKVAPAPFVEQFVASCRATGLNPFLRQIYALPVGPSGWSVYVGIDGYRVVTSRTGEDQGMDGPQWSLDGREWVDAPLYNDSSKLVDTVKDGGNLYCRVGIWRKDIPRAYVGTVDFAAYGLDKVGKPGSRWTTDPAGQLAKCAEMQGRRKAFPADTAVLASIKYEEAEDHAGELPALERTPDGAAYEPRDQGLPRYVQQEIDEKAAEAASLAATEPPVQEGAWREAETAATPPAPPIEAEPPSEPVVPPSVLLNQLAKKGPAAAVLAANVSIEDHYPYVKMPNGGRALTALTLLDRASVSQLLRDWLADRGQPHPTDPTYDENGIYTCGVCKHAIPEPTEAN